MTDERRRFTQTLSWHWMREEFGRYLNQKNGEREEETCDFAVLGITGIIVLADCDCCLVVVYLEVHAVVLLGNEIVREGTSVTLFSVKSP